SGPGTWAVRRAALTSSGTPDLSVPHAHSIYAQGLAEFGLLAVVAGIVLGIAVLRLVYQAARDSNPVRARFAVCSVVSVGFCVGQQAVDFAANIPAAMFLLAFPIPWLDA